MARQRPVIHARDHGHGGADPLLIAYEQVSTNGGGGAGGPFPYCRVRMWNGTNQTVASGATQVMHFNDAQNSDAAVFVPHAAGLDASDGITVLKDGVYRILARMYWANQPDQAVIMLNGVDPDAWAPYPAAAILINQTLAGFVATSARLRANQRVYVTVQHLAGTAKTLYGPGGNYLELQRLGDTATAATEGGP